MLFMGNKLGKRVEKKFFGEITLSKVLRAVIIYGEGYNGVAGEQNIGFKTGNEGVTAINFIMW